MRPRTLEEMVRSGICCAEDALWQQRQAALGWRSGVLPKRAGREVWDCDRPFCRGRQGVKRLFR